MDKNALYLFSLKIRELLNNQKTTAALQKIQQSNFNQEELDFMFMCLLHDGYDSKTGNFTLLESDNSEYLKLVNLVQQQISAAKQEK